MLAVEVLERRAGVLPDLRRTAREIGAEAAERELVKLKLLIFLSARTGQEMQGVVTGVDSTGRPEYREEYLCHDPEERLFLHGRWQEGLVPQLGVSKAERDEIAAFLARMEVAPGRDDNAVGGRMPCPRAIPPRMGLRALDATRRLREARHHRRGDARPLGGVIVARTVSDVLESDPEFLLRPGELRAFADEAGLRVLASREGIFPEEPTPGETHGPRVALASLLTRRPAG